MHHEKRHTIDPTIPNRFSGSDGLKAGALGAMVVAAFFVMANAFAGRHLLETPATLGTLLFKGPQALAEGPQITAGIILGYTLVHTVVFALLGMASCAMANLIIRRPSFGGFAVLLFAVLEIPIAVLVLTVGTALAGPLNAAEVMVANVIAALAMGGFFFTRSDLLVMIFKQGLWDQPLDARQKHSLRLWQRLEAADT